MQYHSISTTLNVANRMMICGNCGALAWMNCGKNATANSRAFGLLAAVKNAVRQAVDFVNAGVAEEIAQNIDLMTIAK